MMIRGEITEEGRIEDEGLRKHKPKNKKQKNVKKLRNEDLGSCKIIEEA